jgi:hypothetical protein
MVRMQSRRPINEARRLTDEERDDLVRRLRSGSWRPFGGLSGE